MGSKAFLNFTAIGLVGAFVSVFGLNERAHAQTEHNDAQNRLTVGSLREITAGGLKAEIIYSGQSAPSPAGSSAFTAIKLLVPEVSENTGGRKDKGRKSAVKMSATVHLEAENGEIRSVSGDNVKPSVNPHKAMARVEGLRPGAAKTVLVEMRLNSVGNETSNTLKIKLADMSGAESEPIELKWMVKDCAGGYYQELRKIAEAGGAQLGKLIAALRTPDKNLPRSFLFRSMLKPEAESGGLRCVKYKRRWNPYEYEWERVCVRYRGTDANAAPAAQAAASREERAILAQAAAFIKSGGADPKLSRNTDLGWRNGKIAEDLRIYLEQDPHPALCTGVVEFSDYYMKNVGGLAKHADDIIKLAARSREVAAAKVEEAKRLAEALPGGHPGLGPAPLAVAASPAQPQAEAGEPGLRQLILALAPYVSLPADIMQQSAGAPSELEMLRLIKRAIDDGKATAEKGVMQAVVRAFAFIEAAIYLNMAEKRYATVKSSFVGSIEGIRAAHDKHCVCGS